MKNPLQFFDASTGEIMRNSLGYQQVISTLTAVAQRVSEQKFYEIPFADFVPTIFGNGAFKRSIIHWRTFVKGEGFASGIMSNASNGAAIAQVDSAYDMVTANIYNWAKGISWNLFEIQEALQAGQLFSLLESRELARAKEWQLGLQKIAFLGVGSETGVLNNASVTVDSSTISKRLGSMSAAEFNTFVMAVYQAYRSECAFTAKPSHFIIPESDFNSLVGWPDATYPLRTRLELLNDAFKTITGNQAFKVLGCQYCDKSQFDTTNNRYVLLNYDPTSVVFNIPIDYTTLAAGSQNGFNWENVAYGAFSPVTAIRAKEMLYFGNTAS